MHLYLLTHRKTYARAVVAASNASEARAMRPDGAAWRHDSWQFFRHSTNTFQAAPSVPWWPDDASSVEVDELARACNNWVAQDTIACDRNEVPRIVGDGPDHWWTVDERAAVRGSSDQLTFGEAL